MWHAFHLNVNMSLLCVVCLVLLFCARVYLKNNLAILVSNTGNITAHYLVAVYSGITSWRTIAWIQLIVYWACCLEFSSINNKSCVLVSVYVTCVSEVQIHLKQISEPLNEGINQDKNAGLVQDPAFWRIPDIKTDRGREKQKGAKKMERQSETEMKLPR